MVDEKDQSGTTDLKKEVEVFFPDDMKKGAFSNSAFISHTTEEFIFDFLAVGPKAGSMVSRVFLTPPHTKRLLNALSENLRKYEEKFGEITAQLKEK